MIRAVIFDIGGVLALTKFILVKNIPTNSVHEIIAKKLGIPLDKWFDAIDSTYAKSIEGKISEKKTIEIFSKNLKVKKQKLKEIILNSYKKSFSQNETLYNFAYSLKKKGYKISILSDQWWLSKRALVFPKYTKKFNVSVISCDVGMRKPNPKIFRLTLKKLRIKPSEALFVDNMDWNTKAAEKLGINTILYKNNSQFFKEIKKFIPK